MGASAGFFGGAHSPHRCGPAFCCSISLPPNCSRRSEEGHKKIGENGEIGGFWSGRPRGLVVYKLLINKLLQNCFDPAFTGDSVVATLLIGKWRARGRSWIWRGASLGVRALGRVRRGDMRQRNRPEVFGRCRSDAGVQFDHMGYAWIRIGAREPDRPIKSVRSVGVATQADPGVVAACKSEHM